MKQKIESILSGIPDAPGVYRMLDAKGRIIYIGKSKSLKTRVHSYFIAEPRWEKARTMAPFIEDIQYTVTDTHLEAKLLECRLIKQVRPYFNVMMKHDDRYVYLKVPAEKRKGSLTVVRKKEEECFGPFRSRGRLEELAVSMRNLYPLHCGRKHWRFEYHLLPLELDAEAFRQNRKALLKMCTNREALQGLELEVERQMKRSARLERYELAARYRNLLDHLRYLERGFRTFQELMEQELVYLAPSAGAYKVFFIAGGMVTDSRYLTEADPSAIEKFAAEADRTGSILEINPTEKERIDYQSIIYTELSEAAPEQVFFCSLFNQNTL